MDYERLFSKNLPVLADTPTGLSADVKYVFSITYANPETLPADGMIDAMRDIMLREANDVAKYPPPLGHVGMREMIAQNLKEERGVDVSIDSLFLSSGAGGALGTILDVFIDPGDIVLVEQFSYSGTLGMLLTRQAHVIHIPTDEQGMDTDALEQTLEALDSQGKRPKMIYTISVYQNPMGVTLSNERRKHMVELSQRFGVPIVENESYADFRIDGDPLPPAMLGMDDEGCVFYVSAFTKLLGCGLRLGYGVIPEQAKDAFQRLRFGISPSHLTAMTVYEYLRNHKPEYVENVRTSLRAKRDALLAALGENFPPTCSWSKPEGGMMVWVQLPEGADTWAALDSAVEAGVKYNPGGIYRADRGCNNYLRLTYSHNSPEEIREGISILAGVFEREGLF